MIGSPQEGKRKAELRTKWPQMLQIDTGQEVPFLVHMGWPVSLYSPIKVVKLKEDQTRASARTESLC